MPISFDSLFVVAAIAGWLLWLWVRRRTRQNSPDATSSPRLGRSWSLGLALVLPLTAAIVDGQVFGYPKFTWVISELCIVMLPVFAVLSFFKIGRGFAAPMLLMLVTCILAFSFLDDQRAMERAQPVIAAIDKYRLVNGSYPESLDALVPNYIDKLPQLRPMDTKCELIFLKTVGDATLSLKGGWVLRDNFFIFSDQKWKSSNRLR
jgi:hypothetical protein